MKMVIVDANTWASVFDPNNKEHDEFSPIKKYVETKFNSMAWGGSQYVKELKKCPKYLGIHAELTKGSRAVRFDDSAIDKEEKRVAILEKSNDFDDPHIIAIQIISKAPIICSTDARAHPFFKKKELYPEGHQRPKIYSNKTNRDLLQQINFGGRSLQISLPRFLELEEPRRLERAFAPPAFHFSETSRLEKDLRTSIGK
ncbi:MAG: hypothetical protein WDN00_02825 [Limisphaerales bacterium]